MVFTNNSLRIHHSKFRKELVCLARGGYREKVDDRRTCRCVIVTSGGRLIYYAIIHLPIDAYQGTAEFKEYQRRMLSPLEQGLDRARELRFKRVVMCTDCLRSSTMLWEEAETTAMGLVKLYLRMPGMWGTM